MKAIVAVDKNWAIGFRGQLLVSIPADMKLFRAETMGHVIVMGRKTLESFPGKRPLEGRTNVVLTRDEKYKVEGAIVVHNLDELREVLAPYDEEDIYVIGGETIYRLMLPFVDTVFVTMIDYVYDADTYFPDLSKDPDWTMVATSEEKTYFDLTYHFTEWRRIGKRK